MKKILSIIAIVAVALITSSFVFNVSSSDNQFVDVREVSVGNHKYVIATSWKTAPNRSAGGVSIIHSAGCNCRNKGTDKK